jgi:hypothetical protein
VSIRDEIAREASSRTGSPKRLRRSSSRTDESADLVDGVDRHDVWMRQTRRRARFSHEPIAQLGTRGELGRQQLDRHRSIEQHFAREIDDSHPAASELAL